MASSARYGSLPFDEQIAFFRGKVPVPTAAWTDIYAREHDIAFMVAGASKRALVETFQASLLRVQERGLTLEQFRRDFDQIVKDSGWAYNGGRNWRTRVIYDTNLKTSYAAGREAQMADPDLRRRRPYGLYRHGGSDEPRPEHLAKDGMVVPLDSDWWETWTPPSAWGCSCKKFMVSAEDAERLGLTITEDPPVGPMETKTVGIRGPSPRQVRVPKGVDPGFEYRPGASIAAGGSPAANTPRQASVPPPIDKDDLAPARSIHPSATDNLPTARTADPSILLPTDLTDDDYTAAFLRVFGVEEPDRQTIFRDVTGELLPISAGLFATSRTGSSKINKNNRGQHVVLIARTIIEPDEIWETMVDDPDTDRPQLRRRYLAQWALPGQTVPTLAVFELSRSGWLGVTGMSAERVQYLYNQGRRGARVYRRGG